MSLLELSGIGHAFFGRTVLEGISLAVAPGEIVALVGPSGSGKSTIAHIAAGLEEPRDGQVARRYARHAMVFQDPRLMPWATAAGNIGFPLRLARRPRRDRGASVLAAAARAGLEAEDLGKYPVELSGGMRQRVAIARALVVEPDFVYFDEPFTALDVALKRRMQDLVIEAARGARFAALFITHDLMEAIRISHRILVLDPYGRGIAGERWLPGQPGERDDAETFERRQQFLERDALFAHIDDIDERVRP
ncbi:ABC transporter ATP-binding protein [Amaricoccus sp.]|uniref:ABC transporter ATP-binding protein n=1 Tax=Amaricoccus sp. TaxID=1872485 RepID=UPI0026373ED0|nr:ATP-binding cassette domain-containing protein [Amaricoccus sp.]HRO10367.1 ATP-binding cassette domain-containing protein [Amaricoccus sp.]